ncbi:CBS domain-containing protein [Alkaliphilus oremlandii]|uniref:CBS domain containing protein n=1 Tax=Alkaliphilus oremlandii (strain OhILAs) TaxID=350688 RepID=A8MIM6_ALKOO|nr:CBS domain-containing protein [Alkaliphilus oremlandii]ABW19658.1 CBS domain containing protein [Alkaliphilus oremlandii OhILAs]
MISINFIVPKESLTLIEPDLDLKSTLKIIEEGNFLSLPVVKENKLIGVISKVKLLKAMMEKQNDTITVNDLLKTDIPSLTPYDDVEDAALLLAETNTPFVAINSLEGNFLGIITHKAIFKHYTHLYGINKGHKLVVTTYDLKGRLATLTDIISKSGANIISLLIDDPNVSTNVVKIILRLETDDIDKLKAEIEKSGFSIRQ